MKYQIQNNKQVLLLLFFISVLIIACSPTRKLSKGEFLLNRNVIIDNPKEIEKIEIQAYIKQKPNRRIFGSVRFHLWLYNIVNKDKMLAKKAARDKKIDEKNIQRLAEHKKPKSKDHLTMGEWLLEAGEAPVILDSFLTEKSTHQIKLFLDSKGYFQSKVKDSVWVKRKHANVFYVIQPGKPYKIRKIDYSIEDERVKYYVLYDTINSLIKKGKNYDVDVLQNERDRITKMLKNEGFYNFSKEYIYFKVDSNLNKNQIDLSIGVKKFARQVSDQNDSIIETNHQKYYINNVFIQTDFNLSDPNHLSHDKLYYENFIFTYNAPLKYKPKTIADAILIHKGDLYQQKIAEDTYKRLTELKSFKIVNVNFKENSGNVDSLDCFIQLSPVLKQSLSLETEGTNTSGNLGISGNIAFQNKNTFKGAEIFDLKLKGGIEAQKALNEGSSDNLNKFIPFNTIQFGPEASINIPKPLFPFSFFGFPEMAAPKSAFKIGLNYQQRPEYTRSIANLSYGITYKENIYKRHTIIPIEVNLVKVKLSPSFENSLTNSHNLLLLNSFSDHFTTSSRYIFVFNNQDLKKSTSFSYLRIGAESSGNILRGVNDLLGSVKDTAGGKDSYKIFNVVYSQYLRLDFDYRFYKIISPLEKIVVRSAFGVGKPLYNQRVLPFEKSFFGGGSNGIRAWRARSLGPGSYESAYGSAFDLIGDVQIEGNVEYRFNIFKMLNGALFVDAGNIWLRKPDPNRSNGDFDFNRFYKEFALGTGIGTRFDFSFFIIRLDLGVKLRDPMFDENKKWVVQHIFDKQWKSDFQDKYSTENDKKKYSFLNLNLGIGYPF